jgi:hypothetical protein
MHGNGSSSTLFVSNTSTSSQKQSYRIAITLHLHSLPGLPTHVVSVAFARASMVSALLAQPVFW